MRFEDIDYVDTSRSLLGQRVVPPSCVACQNVVRTGDRAGQRCNEPLDSAAYHVHRCPRGGGMKARSVVIERTWECIHQECGYQVQRQVYVPAWDRFHWRCPACDAHGAAPEPPAGACSCGVALNVRREEAVLDLEVQSADSPLLYLDVTVRHSVPGDAARLSAAAGADGAVNAEAEQDKRLRYPAGRAPTRVVPLAMETYGRHGKEALRHLRRLARAQAARSAAPEDESSTSGLLQRWGEQLSVALHRFNARAVRAACGATP